MKGWGWLVLLLQSFAVIFCGFVLCGVMTLVINGFFGGFDLFFVKLLDLPYLLYLILSIIVSTVFVLIVRSMTKGR